MGKNWERIPQLMQSHNLWGLKGKINRKMNVNTFFFLFVFQYNFIEHTHVQLTFTHKKTICNKTKTTT